MSIRPFQSNNRLREIDIYRTHCEIDFPLSVHAKLNLWNVDGATPKHLFN